MNDNKLGHRLLCNLKWEIRQFVENLYDELRLYSAEQKIFANQTIMLNNNLGARISQFMHYQKDFDIDDYAEFETIINYKSYEVYLEIINMIKYIDLMLESKQISVNKKTYHELKNILNRIFNSEYEHYKNEVQNLKDLKDIIDNIQELDCCVKNCK